MLLWNTCDMRPITTVLDAWRREGVDGAVAYAAGLGDGVGSPVAAGFQSKVATQSIMTT